MIIVDLQQVMISNLHQQLKGHTNAELDEDMLRHMYLNSLRAYNSRFRKQYGEMVIACDARHSWRKDYFPYYKARRALNRKKSDLDWTTIFRSFEDFRSDLSKFFPYRVIEVDGAEADDIIGTLCHKNGKLLGGSPILIISGDKDFKQLCMYANVDIYNPIEKKMVTVNNPSEFLWELTVSGDSGDDIPNVLSADDTFVSGARQKQLRQTKIEELRSTPFEEWPEVVQRNYQRNNMLINLACTPVELQNTIMTKYEEQGGKGRSHLFNYFVKNRLANLLESINDF